jgi:hypothetical protein
MATRAIIQISEVISDGAVSSRVFEVKQWPVTIGRALDNDLILVDPFVAPHHARIEKTDESYKIVALQTDNGIELGKKVNSPTLANADLVFLQKKRALHPKNRSPKPAPNTLEKQPLHS